MVKNKMRPERIIGFFLIIAIPIVFMSVSIIYLILSQFGLFFIAAVMGAVYIALLSDKVDYGRERIKKVKIPNAPPEIEELLKTTAYAGDLVYVYLLSSFEKDVKLSQTDLVDKVREKYETPLTHQTIRNYIKKLEKYELIHSPQRARDYEYTLTDQGLWCREAVMKCFPKTNFWFMVRHYLGIKKLASYPEKNSQPIGNH
jgi:hypothetical protein